jgi:glyoxylase-like metal-dependent hydrolase (beta-lactamase superfamily II)
LRLTKTLEGESFCVRPYQSREAALSTEDPNPLPFSREMTFRYGVLEQVAPGLRRIVCHNPSPFTFKGTNLYVIGEGEVAVVDPGPAAAAQLDVLEGALAGERVSHILVTHCHSDHSGAVAALKDRTGALTCGMPRKPDDPTVTIGAGGRSFIVPVDFDVPLRHGSTLALPGVKIEALHTPGHAPDHLCFSLMGQSILLSGDHVMAWNTSVIAPPEGNMGAYLNSLELLLKRSERVFFPGHGGPAREPQRYVKALILHRKWRENEILECLRAGIGSIAGMVPRIYAGIEPSLAGAAALSVFAQLEYMAGAGKVVTRKPGPLAMDQEFALPG